MESGQKMKCYRNVSKYGVFKRECLLCQRQFVNKQDALKHATKVHNTSHDEQGSCNYREVVIDGRRKFQCTLCKRHFLHKRNLTLHQNKEHIPGLPGLKLDEDTDFLEPSSEYSDIVVAENTSDLDDFPYEDYHSYGTPASESLTSDMDSSKISDNDNLTSDIDSDNTSNTSDCSSSSVNTYSESESENFVKYDLDKKEVDQHFHENEYQALNILSCFQRNNLSSSACKDILSTFRSLFPESGHVLDIDYIQSFVSKQSLKEIHYCEICSQVFPIEQTVFRCTKPGCEGLRFKGPLNNQQRKDKQPRKSFIIADIKKQLEYLLQTPGILQDIKRCKAEIVERDISEGLTDITDGVAYREMLQADDSFLRSPCSLTGIINTDGVNLYSSSKVELWPVFLAINELNPTLRFARENMLLIGIWQGKGKPPFKQFFDTLSEELNTMHSVGDEIELAGERITIKLGVICGVFDLPAKASILNMTYFNGKEGCITCEDPGLRVKQGKGTSHCYPYRNVELRFPVRNHESVKEHMQQGTDKKRVKGFKGVSGLAEIKTYDLVKGTVPDYMHCILLGITSTLLSKWLSPSQSGKPYFIGKHINKISERLANIKPPQCIERLPRDLEKHYQHLKATELQAWLLFYSIPCMSGILPLPYLQHWACLSEAVYILLGDKIASDKLERAAYLLENFYRTFCDLYGSGSCGLNVHNACVHLIWYVRLWGPIWSWSTFPFEDSNAMLLQSVHGTGNVMKQVMRFNETKSNLRKKGIGTSRSNCWKVTCRAVNCDICGKVKPFTNQEIVHEINSNLDIDWGCVKQVDRICIDGKQFCSAQYSRMERRICYVALCDDISVGNILYFLLDEAVNTVFAVLQVYDTHTNSDINQLDAGKHITPVSLTNKKIVILAEQLLDTLIFVNVAQNPSNEQYVVRQPNSLGHAIFK